MVKLLKHIIGVFTRMGDWLKRCWDAITPGPRAWRGATFGLMIGTSLLAAITSYSSFVHAGWLILVLGFLVLLSAAAILGVLTLLLIRFLGVFPAYYRAVLISTGFLLLLAFFSQSIRHILVVLATAMAIFSLLGAGIGVLAKGGWKEILLVRRIVTVVGLALGLVSLAGGGYWLFSDGWPVTPPPNAALQSKAHITPLSVPNPSKPGTYSVHKLFYGSGIDRHRPEYGPKVDLVTKSVDGSAFIDGWFALRKRYWGFDPEELPLNARVWYPDGQGPFPLVLVVHGNHFMEDYSDPGYEYLGKMLASRGFIVASVDENFLNSSVAFDLLLIKGLKEESDARGWLLLEHLNLWHNWNGISGNPFYNKVDLENIALIGHSRGGEAVVVASSFNRLPYYPDDATVTFNYNFDIRSLVAIAPVDGQYLPTGKPAPLENINYFVLQGVQDMDVTWFSGAKAYKRLQFTDGKFWLKTALYIHGANHGQFNTVWGSKDLPEMSIRLYNLRQLMSPEDQQQIAKVYISAFLETTLRGDKRYLPLFRDYRTNPGWLPNRLYLNQYEDSATELINTSEEDINLTTTALPGGVARGENLTLWREQVVPTKLQALGGAFGTGVYSTLDNSAVYLGWMESTKQTLTASYSIFLSSTALSLDANSSLVFSLADADENPNPEEKDKKDPSSKSEPRLPIDLTIEVTDRHGVTARLPLSSYSFLQPQIEDKILKAGWTSSSMPSSEIVFQTFEFPLAEFVKVAPTFDTTSLAALRFIFDRTPAGVVVLDDIGIRRMQR